MTDRSDHAIIPHYLELLDTQREQALQAIEDLTFEQIWQRLDPKEWCIGEILNHNVLLFRSFFPLVSITWLFFRWTAAILCSRNFKTDIADPYRKDSFPMWTGFLWKPKYSPKNPISLERLSEDLRTEHQLVHDFYEGKDEDKLGNVFLFDPLFGFINLIVALRIGIYHDQLHYEDVIKMADMFNRNHLEKSFSGYTEQP